MLLSAALSTPLGILTAVADEEKLYALEFTEEILLYPPGINAPLKHIQEELDLYFQGKLTRFTTPLFIRGTPFQKRVWETLMDIPYGTTISYLELAEKIGKPTAYRAAANANGANRFVIVVPCHRVINADRQLGGYNAGLHRKKWLLDHERIVKVLSSSST